MSFSSLSSPSRVAKCSFSLWGHGGSTYTLKPRVCIWIFPAFIIYHTLKSKRMFIIDFVFRLDFTCFRALPVHPDPEIWISGSRNPFFWIFRSRSIRTGVEKNLLAKTIYEPRLLLLAHFDSTPPSWGSLYRNSAM